MGITFNPFTDNLDCTGVPFCPTPGCGLPGGSCFDVQINCNGLFYGDSTLQYNFDLQGLTIGCCAPCATGYGSLALGYSGYNTPNTICSMCCGSIAAGWTDNSGACIVSCDGGSIASGDALYNGCIVSGGVGSLALGSAECSGCISSVNCGSEASGCVNCGVICAAGIGSKAFGSATCCSCLFAGYDGDLAIGCAVNNSCIMSNGYGAIAAGYSYGCGSICSCGSGSIASGCTYCCSEIISCCSGSLAMGSSLYCGCLVATNEGSSVMGVAQWCGYMCACCVGSSVYGFIDNACCNCGVLVAWGVGASVRGNIQNCCATVYGCCTSETLAVMQQGGYYNCICNCGDVSFMGACMNGVYVGAINNYCPNSLTLATATGEYVCIFNCGNGNILTAEIDDGSSNLITLACNYSFLQAQNNGQDSCICHCGGFTFGQVCVDSNGYTDGCSVICGCFGWHRGLVCQSSCMLSCSALDRIEAFVCYYSCATNSGPFSEIYGSINYQSYSTNYYCYDTIRADLQYSCAMNYGDFSTIAGCFYQYSSACNNNCYGIICAFGCQYSTVMNNGCFNTIFGSASNYACICNCCSYGNIFAYADCYSTAISCGGFLYGCFCCQGCGVSACFSIVAGMSCCGCLCGCCASFAMGCVDSESCLVSANYGSLALGYSGCCYSATLSTGCGSIAAGVSCQGGFLYASNNGSIAIGVANNCSNLISSGYGSIAMGCVDCNNNVQAQIYSNCTGSIAMGYSCGGLIVSCGIGAIASGEAHCCGTICTNATGAIAIGCANGQGYSYSASILASGYGSMAMGNIQQFGCIYAGGYGALAIGFVEGEYECCAGIFACYDGGFALGYACSAMCCGGWACNCIISQGLGSLAGGYTNCNCILACCDGSFVWGIDVLSCGCNSFLFGENININCNYSFTVGWGVPQIVITSGGICFPQLTSDGFLTTYASSGCLCVDTNTYLSAASAASTYLSCSCACAYYVPYTGACTNVDIGNHKFSACNMQIISTFQVGYSTGGAASIDFYSPTASCGYINLSASNNSANYLVCLTNDSVSGTRQFNWPDSGSTGVSRYTVGLGSSNFSGSTGSSSGPTTIFTTGKSGLYRMNYYIVVVTAGLSGTVAGAVGWNDSVANQSAASGTVLLTGNNYISQTVLMYVASGKAITFTLTVSAASGSPAISYWGEVEAIN